MSVSSPRFLVRRRLIAMAVALPVIETAILWAVGMETVLGIAPQVSAPAPFDVFHDLRWLLVYHRSWAGLVLEAIAFVVFRTLVTTVMVRAAWPEGEELKMHITDADESGWGDSETFGRMLSRRDVLGTDRQTEALTAAEFVIEHDRRVADHLR